MYADVMTDSMKNAIEETNRVRDLIAVSKAVAQTEMKLKKDPESMSTKELKNLIQQLEKQMRQAATDLNFEQAAELRDKMSELKKNLADAEK